MKTDPQTLIFEKKPISSANKVMRVSGAAPMFSSQLEYVFIVRSKPISVFRSFQTTNVKKMIIIWMTLQDI